MSNNHLRAVPPRSRVRTATTGGNAALKTRTFGLLGFNFELGAILGALARIKVDVVSRESLRATETNDGASRMHCKDTTFAI